MGLSVRLDAKTESLVGHLARRRRQSKSDVIRDAIGVLAKEEEKGGGKKQPYDLVAHLIGCVKGGPSKPDRRTGRRSAFGDQTSEIRRPTDHRSGRRKDWKFCVLTTDKSCSKQSRCWRRSFKR